MTEIMRIMQIPLVLFSILFWTLTAVCLKGCDWIFISGVNIMRKEDRIKFKQQHNMVEMNKYIGKMIFLPTAAYISFILFFLPYSLHRDSQLFVVLLLIFTFAYTIRIFTALPKILGTYFAK